MVEVDVLNFFYFFSFYFTFFLEAYSTYWVTELLYFGPERNGEVSSCGLRSITENTFWNEISKKENIVDSVFEWRGMSDN